MADVAGDRQSGTADADVAPETKVAGDRQSGTADAEVAPMTDVRCSR